MTLAFLGRNLRHCLSAGALAFGLAALGHIPIAAAQSTVPQAASPVEELAAALQLEELIAVMRAEGLAYGESVAADFHAGPPPAGWAEAVSDIYAADQMAFRVAAALDAALEGDDVDAMLGFMGQGVGARVTELEIAARAARLDPAVEEAADERAILALADDEPRMALITDYIEANDLIERNLADSLTASYQFFMGMHDGGGLPPGVGEAEVLEDVWGQSTLVRQNLTKWYYSYLYMAFEPLEDAEIEAYTAFSRTPAGQQMNEALFLAFDDVFRDISYAMGLAAANILLMQEL